MQYDSPVPTNNGPAVDQEGRPSTPERCPARLSFAELKALLQAVEPACYLVPAHVLRRVINYDRGKSRFGLRVPHRRSYVAPQDHLLRLVSRWDLGIGADAVLPPMVILIARPSPRELARTPREDVLRTYWRMLFHARIHAALEQRFADRGTSEADVRERVERIGRAEFEEIRTVLRQERYLLDPEDDRAVYVEFAAVYLELRHFAACRLPHFFPAIRDVERIDALLAEDLAADELLAGSRPPGAPPPVVAPGPPPDETEEEPPATAELPQPDSEPAFGPFRTLIHRAKKAGKRGNVVRAAICRMWAARLAEPERVEDARAAARAELDRLAGRLQTALRLTDRQGQQWRHALVPLLEPASHGLWPAAARLLYDLQKVCVDSERELNAIDLLGWAFTLGRRPLKRPLPGQRDVLLLKHLRSAAGRLHAIPLQERDRRRLATLFHQAVPESEEWLRDRLRPRLCGVLQEVGLKPRNVVERVASKKLVEELLDRVTGHGFLTMSDVRDAVSRNSLKLPNLAGPVEFFRGDRLLRANRGFARALDGIYRRGEVYLRWLQRFSSVIFGTPVGRFLTRYVALPFGGSFVILEGLQHIVGPLTRRVYGHRIHLFNPVSFGLLGVLLFGLLHVGPFRNLAGGLLRHVGRGLRGLFMDVPAFLLRLPAVRWLLDSGPVQFFRDCLLRPTVVGGVTAGVMLLAGAEVRLASLAGMAVFLTTCLLFNSGLGRALEETFLDWLVKVFQRIQFDLLPGVFHAVMDFFKRVVEGVDRLLYTVDEWLRFRSGGSRLSLAVKLILGPLWFAVAYVTRFCLNLLIEPQVNPIKHFPVVTVSHKLIWPFFVPRFGAFPRFLALTMSAEAADTVALVLGFLIPGIFGFLVWELKENWRLYRANQSRELEPVSIGHHGETLLRFLKPGFHSGTLPKLYAKLRRAERSAHRSEDWQRARKHVLGLRHAEEALRHFLDRELLVLLRESAAWEGPPLATGAIRLATNGNRISLCCAGLSRGELVLAFEFQDGGLVARVAEPGWLTELSPGQRQVLCVALAGLYKMAGVDRVGEQPDAIPFKQVSVTRAAWAAIWEQESVGKGVTPPFLEGIRLLPAACAAPVS